MCDVKNLLSSELNIYKFHQFSLLVSSFPSFATFDVNVLSSPFLSLVEWKWKHRSIVIEFGFWLSNEWEIDDKAMWISKTINMETAIFDFFFYFQSGIFLVLGTLTRRRWDKNSIYPLS